MFAVESAGAAIVIILAAVPVVGIHVPHEQPSVHPFGVCVGFGVVVPQAVVIESRVRVYYVA